MKYKAVFLDMDGTTLDNHHLLSDATVAVLQELSANGILVGIATGRSIGNLRKYIDQMNLVQDFVPLVCYNGGYGFIMRQNRSHQESNETDQGSNSTKTLEVVYSSPLGQQDSRDILALADDLGCLAQYYNGLSGDVYAVPKNEEHSHLLERYAKLVGKPQVILDSYETALSLCSPAKILLLANNVDPILEESGKRFGSDRFTVIRGSPDPYFVEFLKVGITKGEGVRILCDNLGLPLDQVVAFGDGDNDAEMLHYVGHGCAMKNAKDPAKDAANVVIEWTNHEEGVAKHLRKMMEEGLF